MLKVVHVAAPTRCDRRVAGNQNASDPVQEAHQVAYHLICEWVEQHYAT